MFYLPLCVPRELNLYADVSWCILLRRLNKRAERCTKRSTHIQQPHFAAILHTALTVTQNAVQTTALQTDTAQRRWSFKRSSSGVIPCKIKCLFGWFGGNCCLRLQGLNLVQLDALVNGRRTCVSYTGTLLWLCAIISTNDLVTSQWECPPKRRNTSYRM